MRRRSAEQIYTSDRSRHSDKQIELQTLGAQTAAPLALQVSACRLIKSLEALRPASLRAPVHLGRPGLVSRLHRLVRQELTRVF